MVLEKVIKEWERKLRIQDHWKTLRLGQPKNELEIGGLAFGEETIKKVNIHIE